MDRFEPEGLAVIILMIGGHPNTIYGREGRDQEIEEFKFLFELLVQLVFLYKLFNE